jgi:hypothetical protein
LERPRFRWRSHKKRMDKTRRMGRPMARVASTMLRNRESKDEKDGVNGSLRLHEWSC